MWCWWFVGLLRCVLFVRCCVLCVVCCVASFFKPSSIERHSWCSLVGNTLFLGWCVARSSYAGSRSTPQRSAQHTRKHTACTAHNLRTPHQHKNTHHHMTHTRTRWNTHSGNPNPHKMHAVFNRSSNNSFFNRATSQRLRNCMVGPWLPTTSTGLCISRVKQHTNKL